MKNCKAKVYGERVHSWQCNRPAGYGPDGAYCKVHARLVDKAEATIELWAVQTKPYKFDEPECVMASELLPKGFIDEQGRRNSFSTEWKTHHRTKAEAYAYLLDRLVSDLEGARRRAHELEREIEKCRKASA